MLREYRIAILVTAGTAVVLWALLLDALEIGQSVSRALIAGGGLLTMLAIVGFAVVYGLRPSDPGSISGLGRTTVLAVALLALSGGGAVAAWMGTGRDLGGEGPGLVTAHQGGFRMERSADGLWEMHMLHGVPSVEVTAYDPGTAPTTSDLLNAADFVRQTVSAASAFADHDAMHGGSFSVSQFEVIGRTDESVHLYSPANMRDDRVLDPQFPEALVYLTPRGDVSRARLIGIMYMVPPGVRGPQIGGPLTRWHYHTQVEYCQDANGVPTQQPEENAQGDLACPDGERYGLTPEMMHVWLVDNPWGVFSHRMAVPGDAGSMSEHAH